MSAENPKPPTADDLFVRYILEDEDGPRSGPRVTEALTKLMSEGCESLGPEVSRILGIAQAQADRHAEEDRVRGDQEGQEKVERFLRDAFR